MLTGVIPATEKVLQRAGLTLADIDPFEVNEAFALVVLAWANDTGADPAQDKRGLVARLPSDIRWAPAALAS